MVWQVPRAHSLEFVSSCSPPCCLQHCFVCQLLVLTLLLFFPGNTNSIFALDYISGALTLNGPLDRENPFYTAGFILTVKVRLLHLGSTWTGQDGEDILPGDTPFQKMLQIWAVLFSWASRAMIC